MLWFYCGTDTRLRSERGPRTQSFHPGPIQGLRGPGVDSTLHPHQKCPRTVDSGPPSRLFLQVPLARGINHSSQTPWVEFLQGLLQAACQHVIHSSHEKKGAELDLFTPPPRSLTPDLLEKSRDSREAGLRAAGFRMVSFTTLKGEPRPWPWQFSLGLVSRGPSQETEIFHN